MRTFPNVLHQQRKGYLEERRHIRLFIYVYLLPVWKAPRSGEEGEEKEGGEGGG